MSPVIHWPPPVLPLLLDYGGPVEGEEAKSPCRWPNTSEPVGSKAEKGTPRAMIFSTRLINLPRSRIFHAAYESLSYTCGKETLKICEDPQTCRVCGRWLEGAWRDRESVPVVPWTGRLGSLGLRCGWIGEIFRALTGPWHLDSGSLGLTIMPLICAVCPIIQGAIASCASHTHCGPTTMRSRPPQGKWCIN